jgi:hypothetical protein
MYRCIAVDQRTALNSSGKSHITNHNEQGAHRLERFMETIQVNLKRLRTGYRTSSTRCRLCTINQALFPTPILHGVLHLQHPLPRPKGTKEYRYIH